MAHFGFAVDTGVIAEDDDRPTPRKTFDARRYAPLLEMVSQLVGPIEMQIIMGATKSELKSLAEDEVLVPRTAIPTIKSPWHPDDGLELVAELRAKAMVIETDDEGWESIQFAKSRSGLRVGGIVNAIRKGKLRVGCRPDISGYHGVAVQKDEIDSLADRSGLGPDPGLTPAATFGRLIGLRDRGRLVALVSAGYTPATRMKHPKNGGERYYMTEADIAAFHRQFVTLSTLVSESGEHRNTILVRLKESGVPPFSPGGEDFGHLYLREDVEQVFRRSG